MQKSQKAAAEAEAERDGVVGLENERGVVELELYERVLQISELAAVERVNSAEHDGLYFFVAGERLGSGIFGVYHGVAHGDVLYALDRGGDIADFARGKPVLFIESRRKHADFGDLIHLIRAESFYFVALFDGTVLYAHEEYYALVVIVVTVEYQRL